MEKATPENAEAVEWVSVKDSLPDGIGTKLICFTSSDGLRSVAWAFFNSDKLWAGNNCFYNGVTHWRELPKPPSPVAQSENAEAVAVLREIIKRFRNDEEYDTSTPIGDLVDKAEKLLEPSPVAQKENAELVGRLPLTRAKEG